MYFVQGLGYGLMALGWLMSFSGGLIVLVSFGAFLSWVGDTLKGEEDGGDE